jgi:hypothetical protein
MTVLPQPMTGVTEAVDNIHDVTAIPAFRRAFPRRNTPRMVDAVAAAAARDPPAGPAACFWREHGQSAEAKLHDALWDARAAAALLQSLFVSPPSVGSGSATAATDVQSGPSHSGVRAEGRPSFWDLCREASAGDSVVAVRAPPAPPSVRAAVVKPAVVATIGDDDGCASQRIAARALAGPQVTPLAGRRRRQQPRTGTAARKRPTKNAAPPKKTKKHAPKPAKTTTKAKAKLAKPPMVAQRKAERHAPTVPKGRQKIAAPPRSSRGRAKHALRLKACRTGQVLARGELPAAPPSGRLGDFSFAPPFTSSLPPSTPLHFCHCGFFSLGAH